MSDDDSVLAGILFGVAGFLLGRASRRVAPVRCARIKFTSAIFDRSTTLKGDLTMFVLRIDQQVILSIQPVDRAGNPAPVDGVPQWTDATDASILTPSGDGMSCTVVPRGQLGTTQINVSADADLGEGVRTITGTLEVEFASGEAVGLTINPGAPTPIDPDSAPINPDVPPPAQ